RPGMLELEMAFGFPKAETATVAYLVYRADTKHCRSPHLVNGHLHLSAMRRQAFGRRRYPDLLFVFVDGEDPVHMVFVHDVPGPDGFSTVDPQLPERQPTATDHRSIGLIHFCTLHLSPSLHADATA